MPLNKIMTRTYGSVDGNSYRNHQKPCLSAQNIYLCLAILTALGFIASVVNEILISSRKDCKPLKDEHPVDRSISQYPPECQKKLRLNSIFMMISLFGCAGGAYLIISNDSKNKSSERQSLLEDVERQEEIKNQKTEEEDDMDINSSDSESDSSDFVKSASSSSSSGSDCDGNVIMIIE